MTGAVIFDLFGTLVDAPTHDQRAAAVTTLAFAAGVQEAKVDVYLTGSWVVRHNGTLPTVLDLTRHFITQTGSRVSSERVAAAWRALAVPRLDPDASAVELLKHLGRTGVLVGLISDASAEIAEAWTCSPMAELVDHAVFSCTAGAVKPDPNLYLRALAALNVRARDTFYVGDGGGDELHGAAGAGMTAHQVVRRGGAGSLAFGETTSWSGSVLQRVEDLPNVLGSRHQGATRHR